MRIERYIDASDGTRLFSCAYGDGPPIVLCDGLGCDGFIWKHFIPRFETSHRIIHWNYRGHGLSDQPVNLAAISFDSVMDDLRRVLDAWDAHDAVVVGHSMGVQVVLDSGYQFTDRVKAIVALCGSYGNPLNTFHGHDLVARIFPHAVSVMDTFPGITRALWSRVLGSELAFLVAKYCEVNPWLMKREDFKPYFDHIARMDPTVFTRTLGAIQNHSVEDHLPKIEVPAFVLAGERDHFTPPWVSERMSALLPDSELLIIPGATHIAPIEIPELIHLRLERFLQRLGN